MSNVFDGEPDKRQMAEVDAPVSRFRPKYRALTEQEKLLHDAIKNQAEDLATLIETIKPGRYRSLAITSLEEAIMWAIKELTS